MILKKLKRTSFKKHKAVMIAGLVEYILAPEDEKGGEKTLWSGARNFLAHTPVGRKAEMVSLASESVQSKMPVAHWMLSWQENEQPSQEQLEEAVDVFLERMGLEGHQVIYALHGNTANLHLHIAVNRTHPIMHKVIQPHRGFDIEEAHRIVALLQHKQGWASENNPRYMVNSQGDIVRSSRTGKVAPGDKAANFESATGEKSAQRIAQERGHNIIKTAASWAELHRNMAMSGLRFEKKGSGGVVFVGDIAVKASSIDRGFGLGKLCKRLGDFEPGDYASEMPEPAPEPVSVLAVEEWREYKQLCDRKATERHEARIRRDTAIAEAKNRHTPARQAVTAQLAHHGLPMLNIARHFLKAQQQEELHDLRASMPERERPLPRFRAWLAGRNPHLAVLLKYYRRLSPGMKAERREFAKETALLSPYRAYREVVTKRFSQLMDSSRRDAMIALWMRATGYSKQETANEFYQQARPRRSEAENRNWIAYGRRLVRYAFGVAGDIDLESAVLTPEKVLAFCQEAEKLEKDLDARENDNLTQSEPKKVTQQIARLRMR
ncbi:relaxase/mobilization nuclease domain-containing protein [Desulfovibrio sp. OttesenSCG-928-G15]|nr:relaxase/mobilization nuclease domain-containing protein [Desulfovibrio sp. OttesenSCG-928-G15]